MCINQLTERRHTQKRPTIKKITRKRKQFDGIRMVRATNNVNESKLTRHISLLLAYSRQVEPHFYSYCFSFCFLLQGVCLSLFSHSIQKKEAKYLKMNCFSMLCSLMGFHWLQSSSSYLFHIALYNDCDSSVSLKIDFLLCCRFSTLKEENKTPKTKNLVSTVCVNDFVRQQMFCCVCFVSSAVVVIVIVGLYE